MSFFGKQKTDEQQYVSYYGPSYPPESWQQTGQHLPAVQTQKLMPVGQPITERDRQQQLPPARKQAPKQSYMVGGKIVRVEYDVRNQPRFYSLYDNSFEWVMGKEVRQLAYPDHQGGLYMYLTDNPMQLVTAFVQGDLITNVEEGEFAVLTCQGGGPYCFYDRLGRSIDERFALTGHGKKVSCSIMAATAFEGTFYYGGNVVPKSRTVNVRNGYVGLNY